ncbi:hypothetical protein K1X76_10055 [bacterium]|nr:hypothetical protein [bacterium]
MDNIESSNISYFAVAWVDFLGQSQALEKIKSIPTTVEERKEFIEKAKPTFGHIIKFREQVDILLSQLMGVGQDGKYIRPNWSEEQVKMWHRHNKPFLKKEFIGDAVCLKVSLEENENYHPMRSVLVLLDALQVLALTALANEKPLRGGVDIGICCDFEGGLYGQAPGRAYSIESIEAVYPRIVLGSHFMDYINSYNKELPLLPISPKEKEQIRLNLNEILKLITNDEDGKTILNYLDKSAMPSAIFDETIQKAIEFVKTSLETFKGDKKLLERYNRLKKYFESHGYTI